MNLKSEYKSFFWILGAFLLFYFLPLQNSVFTESVISALELGKWYAREHVILCLIPAFFIAGVIAVFISQASVIKYFGAGAKKWLSYSVAAVSGSVLAVCSCTILPLFSGIYKRGAGLGPATAFLYAGPAVNILAIILTMQILGFELGIARIIGAVVFSVVIGLLMHLIYFREDQNQKAQQIVMPENPEARPVWQTAFHFFLLVFILVFANWSEPEISTGAWGWIFHNKWLIVSLFGIALAVFLVFIIHLNKWLVLSGVLIVFLLSFIFLSQPVIPFAAAMVLLSVGLAFGKGEAEMWLDESWGFAKQILPLLAAGVLLAGFLLGTPAGGKGIIPAEWISGLVGGNSFYANFFASVVGAFMYFATLTEIPILQGLINAGMGKGPALALLLAGPALSLPNMLVIRSVIGTAKTFVYVSLVIVMATVSGIIFGSFF